MEIPHFEWGGENFYGARIVIGDAKRPFRRTVVTSSTVDSLFAELQYPIRFIKCDVEGHELSCIQGAVQMIQKSQPAWLIEISGNPDDSNSSAYQTVGILRKSGYEPFWFDGAQLRPRRRKDRSVNFFFLTPEHLQSLQQKGCPIT
jgi:hypothetical protein